MRSRLLTIVIVLILACDTTVWPGPTNPPTRTDTEPSLTEPPPGNPSYQPMDFKRFPNRPTIHYRPDVLQAVTLIEDKQTEPAQTLVKQIMADPQTTLEDISLLSTTYRKHGQSLAAMRLCQHGLRKDARSPLLLLEAGRIWMTIGRYKSARILFEKAASFRQRGSTLDKRLFNQALVNALIKMQQHEAAGAIITDPQKPIFPSPAISAAIVRYHAARGELDLALEALKELPTHALSTDLIAVQIQLLNGNIAQARAILDSLQKSNAPPTSSTTTQSLYAALAALLADDLPSMKEHLDTLQKGSEIPPQLYLLRMALSMAQGDVAAAREALADGPMPFYEWVSLDDIEDHLKSRELASTLAYAHFCIQQGYLRQSLEALETAQLAYPSNVFILLFLAETQGHLGNHVQAADALRRASKCLPDSQTLRFLQAQALNVAGQLEQAKKLYTNVLAVRPDFIDAALACGNLWERQGNYQESRSIYATTLNYEPSSLPLLTTYAWAILHLQDISGFKSVYRRLKKHPEIQQATVTHLLGWQAYLQRDYPQAVRLLNEALELWPGDPELCYHLGMAYRATNDQTSARELLTYAMYDEDIQKKYGTQVADK
ncbi:tetratricopeptide repeat protein [Planctomycetota bacterium]